MTKTQGFSLVRLLRASLCLSQLESSTTRTDQELQQGVNEFEASFEEALQHCSYGQLYLVEYQGKTYEVALEKDHLILTLLD